MLSIKKSWLVQSGLRVVPVGVAFVLFLLFQKPLENFLNSFVAEPMLNLVHSRYRIDAAVILLIVTAVLVMLPKLSKNHKLPGQVVHLLIIIVFVQFYYRVFEVHVWNFAGFKTIPAVKYLDSVFLLLLYPIIQLLNSSRNPKPSNPNSSALIEDEPIDDSSDDLLSYRNYAAEIAVKIDSSTFKRSFAVGITGAWGSGKTSFMLLLRKSLKASDTIEVDFNPWNSHDSKSLTRDFFQILKSRLEPHQYSVGAKINEYANTLINGYQNGLFAKLIRFGQAHTLEEQFEDINNTIELIGKRIFVFIDDLDRLDNIEVMDVLKLIRNTASFKSTVFIVAYDRGYVANSVKHLNSYNAEVFTEKIFQLEISLPHFEKSIIRKKLVDNLSQRLPMSSHEQIDELINKMGMIDRSMIDGFIVTIRDVVRFSNSLSLNLGKIVNEVVIEEFLYLELIRYKFPNVYELLFRQHKRFFEQFEESYRKATLRLKVDKEKVTELQKYLMANLDHIHLSDSHVDMIINLLTQVFPPQYGSSRHRQHLSVRYPHNFDRYFAIRLFQGDLSDEEFQIARGAGKAAFRLYLTRIAAQQKTYALQKRISEFDGFKDRNDFETLSDGIFYLAKLVGGLSQELLKVYMYTFESVVNQLYDNSPNDFREFWFSFFFRSEYPFKVEAEIAKEVRGNIYDDSRYPFKAEDFERINTGYFSQVISEENVTFDQAWDMFHCCIFKGYTPEGGGYVSYHYIVPGIKNPMIDYIKHSAMMDFLRMTTIIDRRTDTSYSVWERVKDLFDSWEQFEQFVQEYANPEDPAIQEYKCFFQAFKETEFKFYVKYTFEYFKPR